MFSRHAGLTHGPIFSQKFKVISHWTSKFSRKWRRLVSRLRV